MPVHKLLLLLLTATFANTLLAQTNDDYSKNWKSVTALEKKGLTISALAQVMVIYNKAIQDNNDAQQIKSAMYQVKYRNMVQQGGQENNIFFMDTLIATSHAPAKNILQSLQAEMFWQYLQLNRYKFYNRTALTQENSKDISTWSITKLHSEISKLYLASIDNENLLQLTKLDGFDPIIKKGENTRQLRPTLFDFLAFRALDYFTNDETDLTKAAYEFTISNPKSFAPAAEFAVASFATKDTASLHHKAILLFQRILKFHLKDNSPDALLDADFARLSFINQYAVNEDKGKLYETALQHIQEKYSGNSAAAKAIYLRAKLIYVRGKEYDPLVKTTNQYEIKRAKDLCEEAIKKFPKSEGGINAQNLLNEILQPDLSLETEKVNLPFQPFRTLVNYKNVQQVYFRIIKTTKEEIDKMSRREDEKSWKDIVKITPVKSWNVSLPNPQDYQNHAAEIKVDGLPGGMYFILSSLNENFSLQKNIITKQLTYISNISCIHNNTNDYYVLDRDNGQPFYNAQVQAWETTYNYSKNLYEKIKAGNYSTDKNGLFKLKNNLNGTRNIKLQIRAGADELFLEDDNYYSYYNSYKQPEPLTPLSFLFTDRSIYRPGQTVYFKGIVLKKGNKAGETTILPAFKTTLLLKDANNQKVGELQMVTNDFGSYHGSFKLPEGTLNGQFSLYDTTTNTSQYFNVEEYKRPGFFVEVQKPKGSYRLLDSIKVTGTAKAYAGNNIDGATVKYRVVRKVRYPIWWGAEYANYGRKIIPGRSSDEMEITNGEAITDANGAFELTFKALPDESIDKKSQPTFYYDVSADITDINGETRSSSVSVAVAYQMLQLDIDIPGRLSVDSMKKVIVKSTNLNGIEENTTTLVTIQQLKNPAKVFRERYWDQPDQFVMSKEEYYGYFPYDVYKNEDEVKNYEPGEKVFEKTDSSNREWPLQNIGAKAGWYRITATAKDKYGEVVKTEKYVQLYNDKQITPIESAVEVRAEETTLAPGETVDYTIATGFPTIWLINTLAKVDEDNTVTYQAITNSKPYHNQISVREKDRGGMAVSYVFVQHNRVYKGDENFDIPWSNKELTIDYSTFRDKLLPGSEEKWKVKISGSKGEKVAAELLAGMYDASLDQFKPHSWNTLNIWPVLNNYTRWDENGFESINSEENNTSEKEAVSLPRKTYDELLFANNGNMLNDVVVVGYGSAKRKDLTGAVSRALESRVAGMAINAPQAISAGGRIRQMAGTEGIIADDSEFEDSIRSPLINTTPTPNPQTQIRKNFNETAFFFPELQTDADGNVEFSFTIPEALTQWKLMTFAHTKTLASGYSEKTTLTQKPLMVQPNAPRFLREGDGMEFSAKIVNLSDKEITGTTQLELLNAATNQPVDGWFKNIFPTQYFTVAAGQSAPVKFPMEVPFNFNSALTYRITAKSSVNPTSPESGFSDGEEMAIPVLTNRMMVTESMPLNLRGETTKAFTFEKLLNSGESKTLTNHALTLEFTSNPAWYAVQALPYLIEYPYECAEQTFNRYYANTLAAYVSNSMPKIKAVFDKWRTADTAALLSNLQKNEELKSALLQETPWVLEAQNESLQKKNIALLFDMIKMSSETDKAITKLKDMQSSNGGFVWFKGGPDDRYITQYIITGIGHLKKLNALSGNNASQLSDIMGIANKAIPYLDKKIKEEYDDLLKYKANLKDNNLSNTAIQYLYMRSFFANIPVAAAAQNAYNYYRSQAKKYWLNNSKYMQAMIALTLYRTNDEQTAKAILQSLKENSISNNELGMFWKEWNNGGYYWYQAPIESQAMMIEAFSEIDKNTAVIDDLKTWLLKQKQTQNWSTTRATSEACYALFLDGGNGLNSEKKIAVQLGNTTVKSTDNKTEAGTGYFKKIFEAKEVTPAMGNIRVTAMPDNSGNTMAGGIAWGAVYWQYFEDLDKITFSETPLRLTKKLFIEKNTDKGPVLQAIADGEELKVGDKVKVRIELKVDRDMEYVHMKDMRAACMEPINVISGYKWQGGLGYYESTKDASTNFFFGQLPRGSYIFEYPLFVTLAGNYSNGITSIQCMYAPEFTSHSDGIRVNVVGK